MLIVMTCLFLGTVWASQVVYLSPAQTPRQSLLKDQDLIRVAEKGRTAPTSVVAVPAASQPAPHGATLPPTATAGAQQVQKSDKEFGNFPLSLSLLRESACWRFQA